MKFCVQLGHARFTGRVKFAATGSEAIRTSFRPHEESAFLFWHGVPIRIRYRQDLPRCIDDILALVWLVHRDEGGAVTATFQTQLITVRWDVRWSDDVCDIDAAFEARDPLYEPYASALAARPTLRIARSRLLAEFRTLLHQVVEVVRAGGVVIEDGTERRKWELLQRVEGGITDYGELYTRPA